MTELAGQLHNMVEHPNHSQPNPGLVGDATPCIIRASDMRKCVLDQDAASSKDQVRNSVGQGGLDDGEGRDAPVLLPPEFPKRL